MRLSGETLMEVNAYETTWRRIAAGADIDGTGRIGAAD